MRLGLLDDNTLLPVADIAKALHRPDRHRLGIAALPVAPRRDREAHPAVTIDILGTILRMERGEMLFHLPSKLPRVTILQQHHDDPRRGLDLVAGRPPIELLFLKEKIARQPAHARTLLREVLCPPFPKGPKRLLQVTGSTLMERGEQILKVIVTHRRRRERAIDPNPRADLDQPVSGSHKTAALQQ